jgi:hypothetical protein
MVRRATKQSQTRREERSHDVSSESDLLVYGVGTGVPHSSDDEDLGKMVLPDARPDEAPSQAHFIRQAASMGRLV